MMGEEEFLEPRPLLFEMAPHVSLVKNVPISGPAIETLNNKILFPENY